MKESAKQKETSFLLTVDLSKAYDGMIRSRLFDMLEGRANRSTQIGMEKVNACAINLIKELYTNQVIEFGDEIIRPTIGV